MTVQELLKTLIQYYQKIGMGHTSVMLDGVNRSDRHPFVVVTNLQMLRGTGVDSKVCRPVSLDQLEEKLRGASGPMAWESSALNRVFQLSHSKITELEAEVKDLEYQLAAAKHSQDKAS